MIDDMTRLMDRLEEWRKANDLNKSEMSRLIGANSSQQYSNWVMRDSLPKEFYVKAADILGGIPVNIAETPAPERYTDSIFSRLTHDQKAKAVRELLPSLNAQERADALAFLLELDSK